MNAVLASQGGSRRPPRPLGFLAAVEAQSPLVVVGGVFGSKPGVICRATVCRWTGGGVRQQLDVATSPMPWSPFVLCWLKSAGSTHGVSLQEASRITCQLLLFVPPCAGLPHLTHPIQLLPQIWRLPQNFGRNCRFLARTPLTSGHSIRRWQTPPRFPMVTTRAAVRSPRPFPVGSGLFPGPLFGLLCLWFAPRRGGFRATHVGGHSWAAQGAENIVRSCRSRQSHEPGTPHSHLPLDVCLQAAWPKFVGVRF